MAWPHCVKQVRHCRDDDLLDARAFDTPVIEQLYRQCLDCWPEYRQQKPRPLGEKLLVAPPTGKPVRIVQHDSRLQQVFAHAEVVRRVRRYLVLAPLAAMGAPRGDLS
jgi:hypothetical protein